MAQVRIAKQRTVLEYYDVAGHRLKVKGGIEGVLQQHVYRECPKCPDEPEPVGVGCDHVCHDWPAVLLDLNRWICCPLCGVALTTEGV